MVKLMTTTTAKPNHLLEALQTCDVSQYALAKGLEIDTVTVNKLCNTDRRPGVDTALAIARFLNEHAPEGVTITVEAIWGSPTWIGDNAVAS
jgi:DNA-binding XRE family transcriptional regulator